MREPPTIIYCNSSRHSSEPGRGSSATVLSAGTELQPTSYPGMDAAAGDSGTPTQRNILDAQGKPLRSSTPALVGLGGVPLAQESDLPILQLPPEREIRLPSERDIDTLGLHCEADEQTRHPRLAEAYVEAAVNPFRPAARFFESLTVGGPRGLVFSNYIADVLHARTALTEKLRGSEARLDIPSMLLLKFDRGPESIREDFAYAQVVSEYREKGTLRTNNTWKPGPLESVAQAAIHYLVDDEASNAVGRDTPVGVIIANSVGELLRESRIQCHQDGQKSPIISSPPLPSLTSICIAALEEKQLSKELRSELYDILTQVELTPEQAGRILRVQEMHRERLGPDDFWYDIAHPSAIHFYVAAKKEGEDSLTDTGRFLERQRQTGEALLEVLAAASAQDLFNDFDALLGRASTLVYSAAGREHIDPVVDRNIGVEFEYIGRNSGWNVGPQKWDWGKNNATEREISLRKEAIAFGDDWVSALIEGTSFVKDEANFRSSLSLHIHIDQADTEYDQILSLCGPFFRDPSQNAPINSNKDYDTWEIRSLVVPEVRGAPHAGRVVDTARLLALTPEARNSEAKERLELPDGAFVSGAQLIWGHILASTANPEARLAALCALRDPRIFAVFDPRELAKSYKESSHISLAEASRHHVATVPLQELKEKQCLFILDLLKAHQEPNGDCVSCTPPLLKQEAIRSFSCLLNGKAPGLNHELIRLLNSNEPLLSRFLTLQPVGAYLLREEAVEIAAVGILRSFPEAAQALVPVMLSKLHSEDQIEALEWFRTVPQLAKEHTREILPLLAKNNIRNLARDVLLSIPDAITDNESAILEGLSSTDPSTRLGTVQLLGSSPEVAARHASRLFQHLGDVASVQKAAIFVLMTIPNLARSHEESVVTLLDSPVWGVVEFGVKEIANEPDVLTRMAPQLERLLISDNFRVAEAAALGLLRLPGQLEKVESVVKDLFESDPDARERCIRLLAVDQRIATRNLDIFASMLDDSDEGVKEAAAAALTCAVRTIPKGAAEEDALASLAPQLGHHITDDSFLVAKAAALVLMRVPGEWERHEPAVANLLYRGPSQKQHGINLLTLEPEIARRHSKRFAELTGDSDSMVRHEALWALQKIPGSIAANRKTIEPLLFCSDEQCRSHAINVLVSEMELAPKYVHLFGEMRDYDESDTVQYCAGVAVDRIKDYQRALGEDESAG